MPRTIPHLAAWFAAGAATAALTVAAVGTVSRQVTGTRPAPLSSEEVREELAAAAPTTSTTTAPAPSPPATTSTTTEPPEAATRTYDLIGGSATLRFSPAGVKVVIATPQAGFSVDTEATHSNGVRVEFEDDDRRSRVEGWWDGGAQDEVREDD